MSLPGPEVLIIRHLQGCFAFLFNTVSGMCHPGFSFEGAVSIMMRGCLSPRSHGSIKGTENYNNDPLYPGVANDCQQLG